MALVDQGASSVASFGLLVAVASSTNVQEFGRYALLQALLMVPTSAFRAIIGTAILLVEAPLQKDSEGTTQGPDGILSLLPVEAILRLSGILSLTCALIIIALLPFGSNLSLPIVVGTVLYLAAYFLIDSSRYMYYGIGRPDLAAWTSCLLLISPLAAWLTARSIGWELGFLAFGITAFASALISAFVARRQGSGPETTVRSVWYAYRSTAQQLGWLFTTTTVTQLLLPFLLYPIAGLATVGGVRAGQSLAGLGLQVPQGLQPLVLASAIKRYRERGHFDISLLAYWTCALVLSMFSLTLVIMLLVPNSMGEALLGDSWNPARQLIILFALAGTLAQAASGVEIYFRAINRIQPLILLRLVMAPVTLGLGVIGAYASGTVGTALGLVVANGILLVGSVLLVGRERRSPTGIAVS